MVKEAENGAATPTMAITGGPDVRRSAGTDDVEVGTNIKISKKFDIYIPKADQCVGEHEQM